LTASKKMSADILALFNDQLWSHEPSERLPAIQLLVEQVKEQGNDLEYIVKRALKSLESPYKSSRLASATILTMLTRQGGIHGHLQQAWQTFPASNQRDQALGHAFLLISAVSCSTSSDQTSLVEQCAVVYSSRVWLQDAAIFALICLLDRVLALQDKKQIRGVLLAIKLAFFDSLKDWTAAKVALTEYLQANLSPSCVLECPLESLLMRPNLDNRLYLIGLEMWPPFRNPPFWPTATCSRSGSCCRCVRSEP
jgi:hypothetical protein